MVAFQELEGEGGGGGYGLSISTWLAAASIDLAMTGTKDPARLVSVSERSE